MRYESSFPRIRTLIIINKMKLILLNASAQIPIRNLIYCLLCEKWLISIQIFVPIQYLGTESIICSTHTYCYGLFSSNFQSP